MKAVLISLCTLSLFAQQDAQTTTAPQQAPTPQAVQKQKRPCPVLPPNYNPNRKPSIWDKVRAKVYDQTGGIIDTEDLKNQLRNCDSSLPPVPYQPATRTPLPRTK